MPLTRSQQRKNGRGKRSRVKQDAQKIKWQKQNGCSIHPDTNMEHCKNFMRAKNSAGEQKRQGLIMLMKCQDNHTMWRAVTDKFGHNFEEFKEVMKRVEAHPIPIDDEGNTINKNMWDLINDAREEGSVGAHQFADENHIATVKCILTHMWGNIILEKEWGIPDMVDHFEDMAFTLTGDDGASAGQMSSSAEKENYICAMRWYEGEKRGFSHEKAGEGIDMAEDNYWEVLLTPKKEIYDMWVEEQGDRDDLDSWEDVEASQEKLGKQIHKTFGFDLLSSVYSFGSSIDNFKKVMEEA